MATWGFIDKLKKFVPLPLTSRLVAFLLLTSFAAASLHADTGKAAPSIRLSKVIEQISVDPAFSERLLQSLDALPNAWGLLGPKQRARLRDYILQRNWSGIDHFPGLTVAELRASVFAIDTAARAKSSLTKPLPAPYVEVGPFPDARGGDVDWQPSEIELRARAEDPIKDLGYGLTSGDPPDPALWPWHNRSVRTAYLFNRLALNATLPSQQRLRVRIDEAFADSPQSLIHLLARSGYDLWIEDARYFANFGHLHFHGEDVMMPFWLNTKIKVPQSDRPLLVPVSHAEEEIRMRGPQGNADVSFYFGIDGMTEFRTMDTLDQYWVGKRVAHAYRGVQAEQVAQLLGKALTTYAALQRAHPNLPFHGYYRLGVCQDVVAAIEYRMQGQTTLFPITHDPQYFRGSGEIDRLFAKLPDDRSGAPSWERVRGSLPAAQFADLQLPELRSDLQRVSDNEIEETGESRWLIGIAIVLLLARCALFVVRRRRKTVRANLPA